MIKNEKTAIKKALKVKGFKYILLILTGILQSLFSVATAISIKNLLNSNKDGVLVNVIILICLVLLAFLMGIFNSLLLSKLATIGDYNLKKFVYSKFIDGSYSQVDKFSSGEVITRLDGDITKISTVAVALPPSLISNIFHALSIVAVLFYLEPLFTLIMLGLGAIVFLITYFVRKISYKLYDKTRKAISLVNSGVIESKNNFLFIKADNGEDFIKKANDKNLQVFKKHALKQRYFNTTISQFTSFTFTIFNILTILWCVLLILKGSPNMSIGLLVAMIQLVIQIKAPLVNMSSYITVYQETAVSMDRVNELIFDSESEKQKLDGKDFERLEIKELSFSYDNHKVLDSVNLTINKGDKVLIKGISGEGKSTLLKILLGVLKQNGGEVKGVYNGVSYDLYSLNGTCRLVPQGNMLFSGTIKENLLFNNDTATQSEIDEVLKLTCLKDFVNSLEFGIETKLTENSSTISEGQAQRIAIARALLKKAPVLILDEATSSLDEKTEKEIISNLKKIENLTLIAVSHKDAIKDICNKHFEIANGKLNLLN